MSEVVAKQSHPKGLWVLFGTEMWERFNFYGMRAILTLFMVNSLLIKEADAAIIYGGFLALCYLTPLLGGFISDKYIGNRYSIMLGGTLMAIGQFLLFISASTFDSSLGSAKIFMWIALFIIIFGIYNGIDSDKFFVNLTISFLLTIPLGLLVIYGLGACQIINVANSTFGLLAISMLNNSCYVLVIYFFVRYPKLLLPELLLVFFSIIMLLLWVLNVITYLKRGK